MFCYLLMFLEDKEIEEQFILSTLTEYVALCFPKEKSAGIPINAAVS